MRLIARFSAMIHPRAKRNHVPYLLLSITLSLVFEFLIAAVSLYLLTGQNGSWGAPIPVGEGAGFLNLTGFSGGYVSFSGLLFLTDVVATAIVFSAVGWLLGLRAAVLLGLGTIIGLIVSTGTYILMSVGMLPLAGFPIPIANRPGEHVSLTLLWIDSMAVGFMTMMLDRLVRRV